ncbi:MAG: hypothetical protein IJ648_00475 [Lachnospiraceae bacterium]|nr:hypothetical protein [Lachnospiraceae bacterium]
MEYSRHLLDNLYPDNHLLLLEAMIPYIEPSMQLPLALYIKFQEVQFILAAFRNPDRLYSCGFYPGNISNEDLLQTLSRSMGFDLNMYKNSSSSGSPEQASDQTFASSEQASDQTIASPDDFSTSRDDMIDAIKEILQERQDIT